MTCVTHCIYTVTNHTSRRMYECLRAQFVECAREVGRTGSLAARADGGAGGCRNCPFRTANGSHILQPTDPPTCTVVCDLRDRDQTLRLPTRCVRAPVHRALSIKHRQHITFSVARCDGRYILLVAMQFCASEARARPCGNVAEMQHVCVCVSV